MEALRRHIDRRRQDSRLDAEFIYDSIIDIEPRMEVPLFRIAQEALVNVQNHANALSVSVRLQGRAKSVILEVEDDGVGLSLNGARGQNGAGYTHLEQLTNVRLKDLMPRHGFGPKTARQLRDALAARGLTFAGE